MPQDVSEVHRGYGWDVGRIVTGAEMKALDRITILDHGVPSLVLMERAALACVDVLGQGFDLSDVVVVCGPGNNGGDGVAVARLLCLNRVNAEIVLVGNPGKRSPDLRCQLEIARSYGVRISEFDGLSAGRLPTTVVDAILGIGGVRAPAGEFLRAVQFINSSRTLGARVLAVDIPSGVAADTGEVPGEAVDATVTVSFAYSKYGLVVSPGREWAGRVIVKDIGIYAEPDEAGQPCHVSR